MIFALWCIDRAGMEETRARLIQAHRTYWMAKRGDMAFGGPLTNSDGGAAIGSLIVADFESRDAVERWLSGDPFVLADIYESVSIEAFGNVWPQQVGFPPGPIS